MPDDTAHVTLGPLVADALAKLRKQREDDGREQPSEVQVIETVTLRKYDHTPDVPVLVETIVVSESTRTLSLQE
jgi:hypothetical protein